MPARLLFAVLVGGALPLPSFAAARPKPSAAAAAAEAPSYAQREAVQAFALALAEDAPFNAAWVLRQLGQARYQASVARLVMPPPAGTAKNWDAYRARMVDAQRVREGVRWSQRHATDLARAEKDYGVPAEIVAAIVGVETYYGRITGNFRVLDALATLAFDFPSGRSDRSGFYQDELRAFLRWCHAEGRDPTSVRGSYAGAVGLPQFMPSSILRFAVDYDADGRIDLGDHGADVVGSVAHYFAEYGWSRGEPTHFSVTAPTDKAALATLLAPDIVPTFSAAQMTELGAELEPAGQRFAGPLALVELQRGEAPPTYVAGSRNFYVVTRYNWSAYYAMAVIELAQQIKVSR
ncbi:MAG: lytic murein transglycosylase B [Proteobacteria bacterium]|nr:lytic murein transglycosylase B [Pseudomonadota bacterium]